MQAAFGTISHGTMRNEDLLGSLSDALDELDTEGAYNTLISDARTVLDAESEEASDVVNDLFDALNEFAPSYGYFGANEGDGADYGFWPYPDFQQLMRDDGVLQVGDLSDIPDGYRGEVLLVNDHGNCTFGYVAEDGEFVTVWAIV